MLKKKAPLHDSSKIVSKHAKEYKALLRYINRLANHKLGYPVSLLTYLGIVDNQILGINPGTLANVLLNNVGDPFVDSQTSLMEVKKHERKLIRILERYFGLSKNAARGYVTTGGTEGNFASLWWSKRYLINCALETLIKTDDTIKIQTKAEEDLMVALVKIPNNDYQSKATHLQKIIDMRNNITNNKNTVQQLLTPTVFYSKGSTHYSIPKISEILRMNIRTVIPNLDGSINLDNLQKELLLHIKSNPYSSIIVVANIGTTITGAIDDVPGIKKILDAIEPKIIYTIHMDGALTGFVLPILKPFGNIPNYFQALGVNTLVFSAHKYPGLSQPCGIVLATKTFFDKAFDKSERSIDYVGNIRDVTITGSRSGLNVLMFYNALSTLGLRKNANKLKKMLNENIENAKYLHQKLTELFGHEKVLYPNHFNIMFPKPSMKIAKKYQLMLTGETATICVLTNVTKSLIDSFILDLQHEKETNMKTLNRAESQSTKTGYTFQPLTKKYEKSALELFIRSFCDSEPLTHHLKTTYDEYRPYATDVIEKAVKDGLSMVVVDTDDKVVGLVVAEDMANLFKPNFARYPKQKIIYSLLDDLSKPFVQGKKFIKGKVLHTWVAAVDPEHRSQGLYIELGMAHIEAVMNKGYDFIYSDFTNELSEKVVRQFHVLRLCHKITYNDFTYEGSQPFAGLKGGAASYLTPIRPEVKLDSLENCYTIGEKTSP